MSDKRHRVTDSQGFPTDSTDPSLFPLYFHTVAFGKAFRGVYAGDLSPLIRHVLGWIRWLLEAGGGGGGKALNPPVSLYSGLFSTFSSPSNSLPSLFLETSHSRESGPSRLQSSPAPSPSSSFPRKGQQRLTFLYIQSVGFTSSEGSRRPWVQTSLPSCSICGAKLSIWCHHIPGIHLNLRHGGVGTLIDDLWVDWYSCQLHFHRTLSSCIPVFKKKTFS